MKRSSPSRALLFLLAGAGAGLLLCGIRRRMRRIDFRGLSVVISGGSRGLGLEIARQLAREGARISLLARSANELDRASLELTKHGANVLTFVCDVRNRQEVEPILFCQRVPHGLPKKSLMPAVTGILA
ncbi:MAG TPA: SDR family NAD(P)-dependent oxidoreductase [Desulfuromonadaceae bacterium]